MGLKELEFKNELDIRVISGDNGLFVAMPRRFSWFNL